MNEIVKRNLIIIVLFLVILVLSQQPFFERIGKNLYSNTMNFLKTLWEKCKDFKDFWNKHILHRVTTEIEKREEIAKEELKKQTEQAREIFWQKIKNYISGFFRKIFFRADQKTK